MLRRQHEKRDTNDEACSSGSYDHACMLERDCGLLLLKNEKVLLPLLVSSGGLLSSDNLLLVLLLLS